MPHVSAFWNRASDCVSCSSDSTVIALRIALNALGEAASSGDNPNFDTEDRSSQPSVEVDWIWGKQCPTVPKPNIEKGETELRDKLLNWLIRRIVPTPKEKQQCHYQDVNR